MSPRRSLIQAALAISACLPFAHAQSTFPFILHLQQGQTTGIVADNSTITISGAVGQATTLTLTVTYTGTTQVTISSPQIHGSTDFTVAPLQGGTTVLQPNSSFVTTIQYKPASDQSTSAQLSIPWNETAATSGQTGASGTVALTFSGLVASLSVYYVLPPNNNVTPLASGGVLQFPATLVNSSITATIVIANPSSGQGLVNSVTISGDAFQLVQLPLLPNGINSGSTLTFGVMYSPKAIATDTGSLTIAMGSGTFTATLKGSGTNSVYSYSTVSGGQNTPVTSGSSIAFPDTTIGQSGSIVLQIQNTGNAAGTLSNISVGGTGFAIKTAPPLPLTLKPNDTTQLTLSFTPTQAGSSTGRLIIGGDYFDLTGTGIGATLSYSYTEAGVVTSLQPSGVIVFSPVAVGLSSTVDFTITNQGTAPAQITSIGIAGSGSSAFELQNTPGLPATLGAGQSMTLPVVFTPATVSQAIASLFVNSQSFSLTGFGTDPPTLPNYQLAGMSGQVAPYTQPAVTLTLGGPYQIGLHGTLTLTGDSALAGLDPAVQFSTGGQKVSFTIPAGQTQAVFANGLTRIQLQTGTIAGTITLTPDFLTDSGVDVTPASPQKLTVTVPSQAPSLLTAQITASSATSFTIVVTGYSTARSLSALDFQFSGAPAVTLTGGHATVDVSQSAGTWFSSPGSANFGGLFSVTIQFNLQSSSSTTSPITKLQSVSVTATNSVGTSAALTVPLQ